MYVCICVGLMTTEVAFCTSCGWYEKVVKHFLFVCPMNFPLAQSNCRSHLPWSDQWRLLLTKSNWSIQGNIVPWWFIHELCCLCSLLSWSWFTPSGPACLVVVRRKCITWQRFNTNNASVFLPFHQLFCLFCNSKIVSQILWICLGRLAEEFNKIPDHICGEPHVYSLHDLLQVIWMCFKEHVRVEST